jgi:kinesin family protein 20
MRFSAVAREVQTSNKPATAATKIKLQAPGSSKEEEFELIEGNMKSASFLCVGIDVVNSHAAEAESDEEPDALVTYLWDEVRSLRLQLLETQLRNATIEAEVREEVVKESEEHLAEMKAAYDRRLQMEVSYCPRLSYELSREAYRDP